MNIFKWSSIYIILVCVQSPAFNQCLDIGDFKNIYYFNNSISRSTLNKYLERSASLCGSVGGVSVDPSYLSQDFAEDLEMIQNLEPKFITKVAGSWWAGLDNEGEFERAKDIACQMHTVDPYVILQASILENIDENLGNWEIEVPLYVLEKFNQPIPEPDEKRYFEVSKMAYDDWNSFGNHRWPHGCELNDLTGYVPDISKVETRMWFYYRATKYIEAGYESISFGDIKITNDADPFNLYWWDLLSNVREYAANGISGNDSLSGARRGIVLLSAGYSGLHCNKNDLDLNDAPYLLNGNLSNPQQTDQLLFDLLDTYLMPDEEFKVQNVNSIFDNYDRTCILNRSLCALYTNAFGGNTPLSWGWSYSESHPIPYIVEFDLGGNANEEVQGLKTDEEYDLTNKTSLDFLTWGWGGESIWFQVQSEHYRNYILQYMYYRVHELDQNAFCVIPFRRYGGYIGSDPWPGTLWRANNGYGNQENVIKWIWNTSCKINFCDPVYITSEYTNDIGNWTGSKNIRMVEDVNGDGMSDIVGFGDHDIIVSKSNGNNFTSPEIWLQNEFTFSNGWEVNTNIRKLADINGDGKKDIIGFNSEGVKVAKSTGSEFENPYFAFYGWGINDGWQLTETIRETGDFNGDKKIDIIGFGNDFTKVRISNGEDFNSAESYNEIWSDEFSFYKGWRVNEHLRLIGDVNGDGLDDVVGFKDNDVIVGVSNGISFSTTIWYTGNFCNNQGWNKSNNQRYLADVNGDGKDDIVGFGVWGVLVALSNGDSFEPADFWIYDFGNTVETGGWDNLKHIRNLADVNGDGKKDLVGFGNEGTIFSLSTGSCFSKIQIYGDFNYPAFSVINDPRVFANVDQDAAEEIVAFGEEKVFLFNCTDDDQSILQNGDDAIICYPNPSDDQIRIQFKTGMSGKLNVINANGQLVMTATIYDTECYKTLYLTDDTGPGLYFIIFYNYDGNIFTNKFFNN